MGRITTPQNYSVSYSEAQSLSAGESAQARANIDFDNSLAASVDAAIAASPGTPDEGVKADSRSPLAKALLDSGARQILLMDGGASGDETDYNTGKTATEVGTPTNGTASAAWGAARAFIAASNERFTNANLKLTSGFSRSFGFTISTLSSTRSIVGQGVDQLVYDYVLYRQSNNKLKLTITRTGDGTAATSGVTTVESTVVLATATEYHCTIWYSNVDNEIGISVNGVSTTAPAVFGIGDSGGSSGTGWGPLSGTATLNYHDGEIGYDVTCLGELSYASINLSSYVSADWTELKNHIGHLHVLGDSLTADTFVTEVQQWSELLVVSQGLSKAVNHGYSGYSTAPILAQQRISRLNEVRGQICTVWAGNNDGITTLANIATVKANLKKMVSNYLYHGARQVLLLGCPNRSKVGLASGDISDRSDDLELLETATIEICAELTTTNQPVLFVDIWDAFATGNYTPTSPYVTEDAADMVLGITPRSARDDGADPDSTHYGPLGNIQIAAQIDAVIQ